ncbi:MAG: hypothetical protein ABIG34_00300 [Candidatus Peregrinibacteria bacterium]
METSTSTAPADMLPADAFMAGIYSDREKAQRLSDESIVIQSARGDEVVADFWQNDEATVRKTLEQMNDQSGTELRFVLRARG